MEVAEFGAGSLARHSTAKREHATPGQLEKEARMIYGGVSQDEMEVTIRLDRDRREARNCSARPEWRHKCFTLQSFRRTHPEPHLCEILRARVHEEGH